MKLEQKVGTKEPGIKEGLIGLTVFILLIVGCNKILCNNEDPELHYTKEQKDSAAREAFIRDNSSMAYQMSKEFLNQKLKSPSTADYPLDYDNKFVKYLGDSTFHVSSYVDSQNGFGAMIRTRYYAKLKYQGNDQWSLLDINLDE